MKVYQLYDGTLVGFYQEAGFELEVQYYEDIYEEKIVWETITDVIMVPVEVPGYFLPEHWETESRRYLIPEHKEYQYVIIEAHWEYKTWTEEAHWGTREYWLEPHIEIRYRFVGTEEQRAGRYGWEQVDGEWEFVGTEEQRAGRAGWESYEVEIPGCWEDRRVWFPEVTRTTKTWVPMHEELQLVTVPDAYEVREEKVFYPSKWIPAYTEMRPKTVEREIWHTENVFIARMPVYSAVDPSQATMFTVEELLPAPVDVPYAEDIVTIKNVLTGDVLRTTADYIGMATRIDDDEFVVP